MTGIELDSGRSQEIPQNWDFPFKNDPDIKISQLDLRSKFLAIQTSNRSSSDYYFDSNGNCIEWAYRSMFGSARNSTLIFLQGKDLASTLSIEDTSTPNSDIFVNFAHPTSEKFRDNNPLALFKYEQAQLRSVRASNLFCFDRKIGKLTSPEIELKLVDMKGFSGEDIGKGIVFHFNESDAVNGPYFKYIQKYIPGHDEFKIFTPQGEPVYEIKHDFGKKSLLLVQKHLKTGITKILKAPLQISQKKVNEIVSSRPPYRFVSGQIEGLKMLNVPWRKIGLTMGVSLSYSYPVENGQSEG